MSYRFSMLNLLFAILTASSLSSPVFAQNELPTQTLFTNVHLWDETSDGITRRVNVLVENNLIKKIRADVSDAHAEATVINAPGKILMPGLIDSHSHLNMNLITTMTKLCYTVYMNSISI